MADCNPMLTVVPLDKTSVSSVTVYSDRAEVTRLVSVAGLSPGVHEITVEGLTSKADEDSIRIKAGPGCRRSTLLEVSFEVHNKPVADAADGSAAEAKLAELSSANRQLAAALEQKDQALLDAETDEPTRAEIVRTVCQDPRVRGVHDLRTRRVGSTIHATLHLEVDGGSSLRAAHRVAVAAENGLAKSFPQGVFHIHVDPDDHDAEDPFGDGDAMAAVVAEIRADGAAQEGV